MRTNHETKGPQIGRLKKVIVIQRHGDRTPGNLLVVFLKNIVTSLTPIHLVSAFTELNKCSITDETEIQYWHSQLPSLRDIGSWDDMIPVVPSLPPVTEDEAPFSRLTKSTVAFYPAN